MEDSPEGMRLVTLDGSYLEGGGQILRNGTALSAISGLPVKIINIRANRPKPGLMPQHLQSLNLLVQMTNAQVHGNKAGSMEVIFMPRTPVCAGEYAVDTGTAGAISLIIQSVLPPLMFNASDTVGTTVLDMRGGTNVKFSPQIETIEMGLLPLLSRHLTNDTLKYRLVLNNRGCYPEGGGRVSFMIEHPLQQYPLNPIVLTDQGSISNVDIMGWACGRAPLSAAKRAISYVEPEFMRFGVQPNIKLTTSPSSLNRSSGVGIVTRLITDTGCFLTADKIIERKTDVESLGYDLHDRLLRDSVCVDQHTQDQLVIFMALSNPRSSVNCANNLTNHTLTAIDTVQKFCNVQFTQDDKYHEGKVVCNLSCNGLAWKP